MQVPNTEGEDKEDDGPEQDAHNRCYKLEKQEYFSNKNASFFNKKFSHFAGSRVSKIFFFREVRTVNFR
jgi:hypothetical protein